MSRSFDLNLLYTALAIVNMFYPYGTHNSVQRMISYTMTGCSKTVSAGALQHYSMNGQPDTALNGTHAPPPAGRGIPVQPQRSAPQAPAVAQRHGVQAQPVARGGSAPPQQTRAAPAPAVNQQRVTANEMSVRMIVVCMFAVCGITRCVCNVY